MAMWTDRCVFPQSRSPDGGAAFVPERGPEKLASEVPPPLDVQAILELILATATRLLPGRGRLDHAARR